MSQANLKLIKAVFVEAMDKAGEERDAYLEIACGGDAALRAEVEALLAAYPLTEPPAQSSFANVHYISESHWHETAPPLTEGPGSCIGRYKLLEQIGQGGFGVVFMAEQEKPVRRKVALKVIKLGMDTRQVIARFEAERQALAMMDHPNIAKVLDAGSTETGRPYFVMELVRGVPLTEFCDTNKLTTQERLDLFVQVCQAVQHAHQKGIIHRDLKPGNVLVTMHDDKPVPKVIDFGIAKATQAWLTDSTLFTEFRAFLGTPQYTSPEQAQMSGLDVDTRADIYSLGVILYELLTGTTPLDPRELRAAALTEMQRMIRETEPPRPSTRLSTMGERIATVAGQRRADPRRLPRIVRGDLDWIVMKCLEKDRARRYETATGLALDIQRHLAGEAVLAAPPSAAYRIQKFVRRHRSPVLIGASLLIAAVAGTAAYIHGIRDAQKRTLAALGVAEEAQQASERESRRAQHAAAMSDARYLVQQSQLPAAITRATEAWKLGEGKWEDGYLLDEIFNASRQEWTLIGRLELPNSAPSGCLTHIGDKDYLVIATAHELQLYNARTCYRLGVFPLEAQFLTVTRQAPTPSTSTASEPDSLTKRAIIIAVANDTMTAIEIPSFTKSTTRQLLEDPAR